MSKAGALRPRKWITQVSSCYYISKHVLRAINIYLFAHCLRLVLSFVPLFKIEFYGPSRFLTHFEPSRHLIWRNGILPEKYNLTTRKLNFACVTCTPSEVRNHSVEMIKRLRALDTRHVSVFSVVLSSGRQQYS